MMLTCLKRGKKCCCEIICIWRFQHRASLSTNDKISQQEWIRENCSANFSNDVAALRTVVKNILLIGSLNGCQQTTAELINLAMTKEGGTK